MLEKSIEEYINEFLIGMNKENALEFVKFIKKNDMVFEKGGGYWEDKLYWYIKYKENFVCYILIGSEEKPGPGPWIIWSDDSGINCFVDFPIDEHLKNIAWQNIDFCGKGGCCSDQGTKKTIFGKNFDNVCRTTMRFTDPDNNEIECLKKLMEIRKNYITKKL